jgi:tRNA 5-methylaminomethyl-2-thiouridine biosynthesis bifunctional protein
LIGQVPDLASLADARLDQPRFVPRRSGLFVFTALGSRGITWSALGAQVLASSITGAPMPLEADLLDALDPARFVSRHARRNAHRGR